MDFAISDRFGSEFENELQFGSIQFRILKKLVSVQNYGKNWLKLTYIQGILNTTKGCW